MEYQIDYANGQCHSQAHGRKDLIEWLKLLRDETITDIKKMYQSGASVSVLERYEKYITHIPK